jgi:hypothetical protein
VGVVGWCSGANWSLELTGLKRLLVSRAGWSLELLASRAGWSLELVVSVRGVLRGSVAKVNTEV